MQGLCTVVVCAGVANAWVVGTLNQSVEPIRVARTRVAHAVVVHARVACPVVPRTGVVGTLSQSVEPIRVMRTGVVHAGIACARVVHTGVVGTLSQSVEPIRNWQGHILSSYTHYGWLID